MPKNREMNIALLNRSPFTTFMTSGHFVTSQIFDAHMNKLMISNIYVMPDSGIPGKLAFDSVVMRENKQLMSKITIPPRPEEVK